jgi:signal peptidase II
MHPRYRILFYTIALTGFALDQASKSVTFTWLQDSPGYRRELIPGALQVVAPHARGHNGEAVLDVNQGGLLGWLGGWGVRANTGFLFIALAAVTALLFWGSTWPAAGDRDLCIALGLLLAGTLGNLSDRIFFGGIRDFLHWYGVVDWPVFNLADCSLVVGAALLLMQVFRPEPASTGDERPVCVPTLGAGRRSPAR